MTVWERRDLPVLRAVAASENERLRAGFLSLGHDRGRTTLGIDLSDAEIHDSLLVLRDAGYVDFNVRYETGPGALLTQIVVTGRGQQALGEWPLFDEIVSPSTLALLLERLAEEATEEEADSMRKAARYMRSLSATTFRALATGATASLLRQALGLG